MAGLESNAPYSLEDNSSNPFDKDTQLAQFLEWEAEQGENITDYGDSDEQTTLEDEKLTPEELAEAEYEAAQAAKRTRLSGKRKQPPAKPFGIGEEIRSNDNQKLEAHLKKEKARQLREGLERSLELLKGSILIEADNKPSADFDRQLSDFASWMVLSMDQMAPFIEDDGTDFEVVESDNCIVKHVHTGLVTSGKNIDKAMEDAKKRVASLFESYSTIFRGVEPSEIQKKGGGDKRAKEMIYALRDLNILD